MSSSTVLSGSPAALSSVKAPITAGTAPVIATVGAGSVATGTFVTAAPAVESYIYKADSTADSQITFFFSGASTIAGTPPGVASPSATWSANVNSSGIAGWTITAASQSATTVYGYIIVA